MRPKRDKCERRGKEIGGKMRIRRMMSLRKKRIRGVGRTKDIEKKC